jgi:hypothetical protein
MPLISHSTAACFGLTRHLQTTVHQLKLPHRTSSRVNACIPCYCRLSFTLKCVCLTMNTLSSLRVTFTLWCPCSILYNILWRICAMHGTYSPTSGDVTSTVAAMVTGQSTLHPPSSQWRGSASQCDVTRDTAVDSDNRQQATGNGIKSRQSSMWS